MDQELLAPDDDAVVSPKETGLLWIVIEDEDVVPFIALWRPSDGAFVDMWAVHRILDAIVHYPEVAGYLLDALVTLGDMGFPLSNQRAAGKA